ncbi:hypothetical protein ES708_13851 [subsurface metagenome]
MIGFRLKLKHLSDGRLFFTIPLGYKLLLFLIGLLILISLIITRQEGLGSIFVRENTIPLIICFLSFLGAAYHERWIFDKKQNQIVHQNGIFALHRNKVYGFSDFERIEITQLGMIGAEQNKTIIGKMSFRPVWSLLLIEKTGRIHKVETYKRSQLQHAERIASTISAYCRISLKNPGDA